jgi:methionine synthase II (cobalamin-independent)
MTNHDQKPVHKFSISDEVVDLEKRIKIIQIDEPAIRRVTVAQRRMGNVFRLGYKSV